MENVHIVFGHSAAAGLREALMSVGNKEKVVNCWGDYQAGPITVSLEDRVSWLCEHYYGVGDGDPDLRDEYIERRAEFVALAANQDVKKTVWYGERCANDYCGYLAFLHAANGDHGMIQTVELCKALPAENARLALSAGSAPADYLISAMESLQPVGDAEYQSGTQLWAHMQTENAELRVFTTDGLMSADAGFFDEAMLDFITRDFQPAAHVVGRTLGYVDGQQAYSQGNGDLFYFSRLKDLHRQGRIEWRGEKDNMREAAIRLAS